MAVSSHTYSSHMSFESKPIEFDGFRISHVYSSQRGWGCCGILAGFSVISNILCFFLAFFDFKTSQVEQ